MSRSPPRRSSLTTKPPEQGEELSLRTPEAQENLMYEVSPDEKNVQMARETVDVELSRMREVLLDMPAATMR